MKVRPVIITVIAIAIFVFGLYVGKTKSPNQVAASAPVSTPTPAQPAQDQKPAKLFVLPDSTSTKGTWEPFSAEDKLAYPNQVSELDCLKTTKICTEATASVGWGGKATIDMVYYDISKWDSDGILASDSSSVCNVNQVSINFQSQVVTVTDMRKKNLSRDAAESCNKFLGTRPQAYHLIQAD